MIPIIPAQPPDVAAFKVPARGADGKERSKTLRTKKDAERYERAQQTSLERGVHRQCLADASQEQVARGRR